MWGMGIGQGSSGFLGASRAEAHSGRLTTGTPLLTALPRETTQGSWEASAWVTADAAVADLADASMSLQHPTSRTTNAGVVWPIGLAVRVA